MSATPKVTIFLPVDGDFPEAEFAVDGQEFSVRNRDGRWVVELMSAGPTKLGVNAAVFARGLASALRELEMRRLPHEPQVEQA